MEAEEIYLSSEESPEHDPAIWNTRSVVVLLEQQHHHVPGRQRLSILEGNILKLERWQRRAPMTLFADAGFLDPAPEREVHVPWGCIAVVLAAVAAFVLTVWQGGFGLTDTLPELAAVLAVVGAVGAGAGWLGWRRYRRMIVFRSRHGRVALVRLVENHPEPAAFRTFAQALRAASEEAVERLPGDQQRFLVEELREHRRLANLGGMDPAAYEAAKARILSRH